MDRRISMLIVLFITVALGCFLYRKLYYKHEGIDYAIRPPGAISMADSIVYSDKTKGATRWKWDFGDGEFSAGQSGKHTYLSPGKFNVKVTVYGPFGMLQGRPTTVMVLPLVAADPESRILGDSKIELNKPVSFKSSTAAEAYEWHIEGEPAMAGSIQKGKMATYSFNKPGTKKLVLTMHNPDKTLRHEIEVIAEVMRPAPPVLAPPVAAPPLKNNYHPKPTQPKPYKPTQADSKLPEVGNGEIIQKEKK